MAIVSINPQYHLNIFFNLVLFLQSIRDVLYRVKMIKMLQISLSSWRNYSINVAERCPFGLLGNQLSNAAERTHGLRDQNHVGHPCYQKMLAGIYTGSSVKVNNYCQPIIIRPIGSKRWMLVNEFNYFCQRKFLNQT